MKDNADARSLRIDKLLWFLRLARTRSAAQALVATGHIRVDGKRVERPSLAVAPGCTIVLPGQNRVRVVRLVQLPARRGSPAAAAACYEELDTTSIEPGRPMPDSCGQSPTLA